MYPQTGMWLRTWQKSYEKEKATINDLAHTTNIICIF